MKTLKISNNEEILLYLCANTNIVDLLNSCKDNKLIDLNFEITKKGSSILKKIKVKHEIDEEELNQLVEDYRSCFLSFQNKPLKPGVTSSRTLLKHRLKEFKEDYDYSNEQILKAIKNYVSSESQTGFQYLQKAHYTVKKKTENGEESRLLAFLEELSEDDDLNDRFTETI